MQPPSCTNFVTNFFADLVTSVLQPSPLYFSTSTLNSVWPPKIYRQTTGISSAGVCSSLCSLDASTCELYVYIASSGICNLGWLTGAYSVAPSSGTGSEVMYTRIRELTHGAFNFYKFLIISQGTISNILNPCSAFKDECIRKFLCLMFWKLPLVSRSPNSMLCHSAWRLLFC